MKITRNPTEQKTIFVHECTLLFSQIILFDSKISQRVTEVMHLIAVTRGFFVLVSDQRIKVILSSLPEIILYQNGISVAMRKISWD